jgi:endoglucanase
MVILDEHDYQPCGENPESCYTKLIAVWEQIAARYSNAPDSVVFEVLNEPNSKLTPALWNVLFADVLAVIRRTNPSRAVVVGPGEYNHLRSLDALALPRDDANLIVTVHYYDPFRFTHQGATWTHPSRVNDIGIGWGSDAEREELEADIARVAAWGRERGRPILIGEFGAFDKAEMDARVAWTSAVARAAEAQGLAWTYWQFEGTFGTFDIKDRAWIEPIHEALVPR